MQIGPVQRGVRLAMACDRHGAQAQLPEIGAPVRVAHPQRLGKRRTGLQRIGETPVGQHPRGIGPELQARAHLAKRRRLLQQHGRHTLARQGQGAGQAADASTGDDHLLVHAGIVPVPTGGALTESG